jgi:hypothetical protein
VTISEIVVGADRVVFPSEVQLVGESEEDIEKKQKYVNGSALFAACYAREGPSLTCSFEIVLFTSIMFLLCQEFLQMYALGARRYFRYVESKYKFLLISGSCNICIILAACENCFSFLGLMLS